MTTGLAAAYAAALAQTVTHVIIIHHFSVKLHHGRLQLAIHSYSNDIFVGGISMLGWLIYCLLLGIALCVKCKGRMAWLFRLLGQEASHGVGHQHIRYRRSWPAVQSVQVSKRRGGLHGVLTTAHRRQAQLAVTVQ